MVRDQHEKEADHESDPPRYPHPRATTSGHTLWLPRPSSIVQAAPAAAAASEPPGAPVEGQEEDGENGGEDEEDAEVGHGMVEVGSGLGVGGRAPEEEDDDEEDGEQVERRGRDGGQGPLCPSLLPLRPSPPRLQPLHRISSAIYLSLQLLQNVGLVKCLVGLRMIRHYGYLMLTRLWGISSLSAGQFITVLVVLLCCPLVLSLEQFTLKAVDSWYHSSSVEPCSIHSAT